MLCQLQRCNADRRSDSSKLLFCCFLLVPTLVSSCYILKNDAFNADVDTIDFCEVTQSD